MAETDIVTIGIAYDTSRLVTGTRQAEAELRKLEQAEKTTQQSAQTLERATTQAGAALSTEAQGASQATQALTQTSSAATQTASATQSMEHAAQQAAQAMGQTLATAVSAAAKSMIEQQRAAKQAAEETRKAQKAAEEAARPFGAFGEKLKDMAGQALSFGAAQVGLSSLGEALRGLREAFTSTVQAAIKLESLQATFKAVSGSTQGAERDLSFLRDTTERLGIGFTDLAKGYTLLSASAQHTSVTGDQVQQIFTAIAEKGRVLGLSAQDIQGAMLAVSQSFSKGTVQAEELRGQFGERMPGALNEVSRALGVTTADLDKMMERGQVGIDMWAKWARTVHTDLAGATADASKSAGAAIERLGNDLVRFREVIGQAFLPGVAAAINALHNMAAAALSALDAMNKTAAAQKAFEAQQREVQQRGGGTDPGAAARKAELDKIQERLRIADQARVQPPGDYAPVLGLSPEEYNRLTARRTELLKEQAQVTKSLVGDEERRRDAARSIQLTTIQQRDTFLTTARQMAEAQKKAIEDDRKASRAGLGRDPSADEKRKLLEEQLSKTQEFLKANADLATQYKDDPAVKALRARGQETERFGAALDAADQAGKKADADKKKRDREEEQARKEAYDATFAAGKQILEGYDKEGDLLADLQRRYEQLKYTEEERLQLRVNQVEDTALRAQMQQLLDLAEAEKARNDQLRERNKLLADQATASKAAYDDVLRLEKQLEPQRRSVTREDQLARVREELFNAAKGDPDTMAKADAQIAKTLDVERWQKVTDSVKRMTDDLVQAFTDMATSGEVSFKRLSEAFTRSALQMVMDALDVKGTMAKWFQQGVNALSGLFGSGASTLDIAAGASSVNIGEVGAAVAGLQHGGPVDANLAYVVGEQGPELFVPRQNGLIVPHGESVGMGSPRGAGGRPVTVNMYISTPDAKSFQRSQGEINNRAGAYFNQLQRNL